MELQSITKIEQFMTNALLSSPLVPLGVNVIRLADVSDEEGITQMVNSMVVRYTDSSTNVVSRAPLAMERTLNFEVNIACQSYLSTSGHDFAVQLLAAAHETLINQVPCGTGLEVLEPFVMTNERFTGLTDSSHYTYTQQWTLIVQDYYRGIALDPCVAKGTCSKLFAPDLVQKAQPGDIIVYDSQGVGFIAQAVLPPPNDSISYDKDYVGVELDESGNLVYKWDPEKVFMSAGEIADGCVMVPTGTTDESGHFYIVNIRCPDGEGGYTFSRRFFAANTGRKLLQLPSTLYRSRIDQLGMRPLPGSGELIERTQLPRNSYGYVSQVRAFIYADPTDSNAIVSIVQGGDLFPVQDGLILNDGVDSYYRIGGTALGKAWINVLDFKLLNPNEYLPQVDISEPELEG